LKGLILGKRERLKMRIRKAEPIDFDQILRIQKLAYLAEAEIYGDFTIPPLLETKLELQARFESAIILVAEAEGAIIGSIRGKDDGAAVVIGRLSVSPDWQGKGVGKALLRRIEMAFPEGTCFELFTGHKSEKNKQIYQSQGYRWFRSEKVNEGLSLYWMRRCA
jgi:GNAT superfamily N-acetyltransferase